MPYKFFILKWRGSFATLKIFKLKKVFSGIQPTGNIHIGNYLGAIKNWITLQNDNECLFGVMNLHAITLKQNPVELKNNILKTVATYIACGLDLKKSKIFIQSDVPEHLELAWVLGTLTPLGWLNRMTQFKDKVGSESSAGSADGAGFGDDSSGEKENKNANLGLYSYPVLMASDILLYKADYVPVGEDQKQHLELTRDIAGAFNRSFGIEYFKLPEPLIIKQTKRIMSLQDGAKKMSKSDPSLISRINLDDSADEITKKIKKSKTDSIAEIYYDESRPEIYNLLNIFASFSKKSPTEVANEYQNHGFGKFKQDLAEVVIAELEPISKNIHNLLKEQSYLLKIIEDGKLYAKDVASKTRQDVYKIIGLN